MTATQQRATKWTEWLAVFSIAAGTFVMVTTEFLPVGLLPQIAAGIHVSMGDAGWLVTVPGLLAAVAAPTLTLVAGRVDRRTLLVSLSLLIAISNIVCATGGGFAGLLFGRVLLGICVGGFWASAANVGRQLVAEASRTRATSIILAGISAGTVCGLPLGAWIGSVAGWRTAFGTTAALAGLVVVLQAAVLASIPVERSTALRDLLAPFTIRSAQRVLLVTVLLIGGYFTGYTFLTPFLSEYFRQGTHSVALLLFAYGVSGLIGTFLGERLLAVAARTAVFWVSLLLALVMLTAFQFPSSFLGAALFASLLGAAFGAIPVCLTALMFEATPETPETGQAILVVVFQLALASGSGLGGFVVDRWSVRSVMTAGGLLAMLSIMGWIATSRMVAVVSLHRTLSEEQGLE